MRFHRPIVLVTLLAIWSTAAAAAPATPRPQLVITEPQLTATTDFRWSVTMQFQNPLDTGIYTDSLICEAQDLDAGITRGPRARMIPIGYVKRQVPSIGTQEKMSLAFGYTAVFEHARLVMRYYCHDQFGNKYVAADTVEMMPAAFAAQNASVSFPSDGHDVEYYFARAPGSTNATPTVLLVHGDQSHARYLMPLASELCDKGYNVMAVSQPGYGRSAGTPDLMGPGSLHALEGALAALKRTPGVDTTRIAVWGIDRGGTLATRLAMTRPDLAGAISTRGLYDLPAVARASAPMRAAFTTEAGRDTAAWRQRSPSNQPAKLAAPLLIEYTATDNVVPAGQAEAFAARLTGAGQPAEVKVVDGADRPLPYGPARDEALAFLERVFTKK